MSQWTPRDRTVAQTTYKKLLAWIDAQRVTEPAPQPKRNRAPWVKPLRTKGQNRGRNLGQGSDEATAAPWRPSY
jgi:hypothetical protein